LYRFRFIPHQHSTPSPVKGTQSEFRHNISYVKTRMVFFFLSLFFGVGTCSLRMPALRPASQAGPMRNPWEGTGVVLRGTITLTRWWV